MRIDLDAAAAARREANGEPPVIVFHGHEYVLPVEMPYEVSRKLAAEPDDDNVGATHRFLEALMGTEAFEKFLAEQPSARDVGVIMDGITEAYGVGLGESEASPGS